MAWFCHVLPGFGIAFFSSWCQFSLFGMLIGLRAKRLRTVSPVGLPIAEAATLGGPAGGRALGTPGGVPATAAGHGGEPGGGIFLGGSSLICVPRQWVNSKHPKGAAGGRCRRFCGAAQQLRLVPAALRAGRGRMGATHVLLTRAGKTTTEWWWGVAKG